MHSQRSAHSTSAPVRGEVRAPSVEAARAAAAATNAQLQAMQALTDTALSHLALDDLLRELLGRLTAVMGVDNAALLLLDDDGQTLIMRAARGRLEEAVGQVRIPLGQGFAGRVAASRAPLVVDDTSAFDRYPVSPLLRERVRSLVDVPLLVEKPVGEPVEDHLVKPVGGQRHRRGVHCGVGAALLRTLRQYPARQTPPCDPDPYLQASWQATCLDYSRSPLKESSLLVIVDLLIGLAQTRRLSHVRFSHIRSRRGL